MQGYGHTFEYGTDGTSYTALANVRRIQDVTVETGFGNRRTLSSTDQYDEQAPSWFTPGDVEVDALFSSAIYGDIRDFAIAKTLLYIRITNPLETGQSTAHKVVHRAYAHHPNRNEANTDDDNEQVAMFRFKVQRKSTVTEAT